MRLDFKFHPANQAQIVNAFNAPIDKVQLAQMD